MLSGKWGKLLAPACGSAFVLGALAYILAVGLAGGSVAGLLLYALAFLLLVVAPGFLLCKLLLPAANTAERLVLGFAFGSLLLMLCFATLGRLNTWLCLVPSLALGVTQMALWLRSIARGKRSRRTVSKPGWLLVAMLGAALAVCAVYAVLNSAKPSAAGNMTYNMDLLWSVGNASAVQWGTPLRDIRTVGGVLHYHYLADATTGLTALASGQAVWDAMCYYAWPLWFGALLAGLYLLARHITQSRPAALLAPFAAVFLNFLWGESIVHLLRNMYGVVQSNLLLVCALLALGRAKGWRGVVALGACVTALCWCKSTVGVLLLCALLAACAVAWLRDKRPQGFLLAGMALGALGFGLLYAFVYSGATNNLIFQPSLAKIPEAARTLFVRYLPVGLAYLGGLVMALMAFKKLSVLQLAVHAMVPGGVAAFVLFDHYSASERYFLLTAGFAMCLCALPAIAWLLRGKPGRVALSLAVAAGCAVTLYTAAPELRLGMQVALRTLHLRPQYEWVEHTITTDDEAAAEWLRENLGPDDVFATNRNAQSPQVGEGVFHYYTAASGRQAYVESWRYAMDYSMDYFELRHNLEVVSDGIFAAQSWKEAAALARQNGIGYLLVHLPSGGTAFVGGQPVFSSETVLLYAVE